MVRIFALSGALRRGSYNAALLRLAAEAAPAGMTVEIGSIRDVPLYDGDVEAAQGFPPAVVELKRRVLAADGLLFVTPEYNNSLPGVFKNAVDWISRGGPEKVNPFDGKPIALMGASDGLGASRQAQTAWLPVFRALNVLPWFGRLIYLPNANKAFDAEGRLVDEKLRDRVTTFMAEYGAFVARFARP